MTTWEILQDSATYQEIVAEAELAGVRKQTAKFLTARFGKLPSWATDRIQSADMETLFKWTKQYFTATTLEDALA